ncbi:hypothetical protein AB9E30_36505, partial [Rhizobium leguminosarum]
LLTLDHLDARYLCRPGDDPFGQAEQGIDVQVSLVDDVDDRLRARRRSMAGPVGCGLCGIESIEQAVRPEPDVSTSPLALSHADIVRAVSLLNE